MSSSSKLLGMYSTYGVAGTSLVLGITGLVWYFPLCLSIIKDYWKEKNYWMLVLFIYMLFVLFFGAIFQFYWAWLKW